MNILVDEFSEMLYELEFNLPYLLTLLEKTPSSVVLRSEKYDDSRVDSALTFSFRTEKDEHFALKRSSFSWTSGNLEFLLGSKTFAGLLANQNLVYCYCFNQDDAYSQSHTNRQNPNVGKRGILNNNSGEFILHDVDISQNWGRVLTGRGITLMAAPLMWFGDGFFDIIPKGKLLSFKYSTLVSSPNAECVCTKLFDFYDEPSKPENRQKQKEFWKFFDLENQMKHWEEKNPIDAIAFLKARAAAKRKKKG